LAVVDRELIPSKPKTESFLFAKLLNSVIRTHGAAPPEQGLNQIEILFQRVNHSLLQNAYSTNTLYSRLMILIVEAVCLAITSDLSAGSLSGRRWRDEEEYLIRKRIHADLREAAR
jgi:hypothetical protein